MTALIVLVAMMMMGNAWAIVELDCSDNATCIENMATELARSLKHQKSVRIFHLLTIEPLSRRQARSTEGWLTRFLEGHAFSFDWNDYTFKISQPEDMGNVLDLEIYEGRTAKDVSDPNAKKSSSKAEEEKEEDKGPHRPVRIRRRHKKKVMQVIIPLLFGMKSAGIAMFAFALVAAITLKAFVASKIALIVTAGMAVKKLYETYGSGVGLQNHPYLYSQYPIDFPSASSHAYSVSGVSQQFASPEMYSPTALGTNAHANEILHQGDATAQQSQQAPTLINSTRAAERWDGKSKLQHFLEPIVSGIRNAISPIADAFYGAMPATFRGLNTDVSTTKSIETVDVVESKPKEILVAQPRNYVQKKLAYRKFRGRPKKYTELKVSLDRLKNNKDLHDYVKTKKYKYNYPNTYFYPRVKYFANPSSFYKPNNSRLMPYKIDTPKVDEVVFTYANNSDWRPIVPLNQTVIQENLKRNYRNVNTKRTTRTLRGRFKRSIEGNDENNSDDTTQRFYSKNAARSFFDLLHFLFATDPLEGIVKFTDDYAETVIKRKSGSKEPGYYSFTHKLLMLSLDIIDGLSQIHETLTSSEKKRKKVKRKSSKCTKRNN